MPHHIPSFYLYLTLMLCLPVYSSAFFQEIESIDECKLLMKQAGDETEKGNYAKGLEYMTYAETMAKENKWNKQLLDINTHIGKIYNNMGNYGEAMGYYIKALEIANTDKKFEIEIPLLLTNIGTLYYYEKDYVTAIDYYKKALPIAKQTKDDYSYVLASINIASTYITLGDYRQAYKYLKDVKAIPDIRLREAWEMTYAEAHILAGEFDKAQVIIDKFAGNIKETNELYPQYLDFTSKLLLKQGKTNLAILSAKKGLRFAKPQEKIALYENISDAYLAKADYANAMLYKDSVVFAKDAFSATINRQLFESNKVKQKIWEYEKESDINKEKLASERKLFYLILIAVLLIVGVVIMYLRQKRIVAERNKQLLVMELEKEVNENLLLEKEIKQKETKALLEEERLKGEIETRNRKISAKALFLSDRNRLIDEILESISSIPELSGNTFLAKKVSALKSYLRSDNGWDDFIAHFEEVNPGFLNRLKTMHPLLTANDMRFIAYTYMNLSVKEISGLLNITNEACKKRKERILAKMELDSNMSLYDYISTC